MTDSSSSVASQTTFVVPSFAPTIKELVTELNSEQPTLLNVVQLIECTPLIASKLIEMANSPLFGAGKTIRAVRHAAVILGLKTVGKVALSIAASDVLAGNPKANEKLQKELLRKSLSTAIIGKEIAAKSRVSDPDEAFLAGIMHDIGKLATTEPNDSGQGGLRPLMETDMPTEESRLFGTNHSQLGYQCAKGLGLREEICKAILQHHESLNTSDPSLSQVLVSAKALSEIWKLSEPQGVGVDEEKENEALAAFDLDAREVEESCRTNFEAIAPICMGAV